MASVTTHIYSILHGYGVANTGEYPYIAADFDIKFTRNNNSQTVSWAVLNNEWAGTDSGSGHYGFNFYAFISINKPNPTWNDLYYIISKDANTGTSWWNQVTLDEPSGSITSDLSTAKVYIWVKERDSCTNDGSWCYDDGDSYYLIDTVTVPIPAYNSNYNIVYDANGGTGEPDTQVKTAGHALTLSSQVPTYPLKVRYYEDLSLASDTFTGNGSTTTFTLTRAVHDVTTVTINGTETTAFTVNTSNRTITFTTAPANNATIFVEYNVTPLYTDTISKTFINWQSYFGLAKQDRQGFNGDGTTTSFTLTSYHLQRPARILDVSIYIKDAWIPTEYFDIPYTYDSDTGIITFESAPPSGSRVNITVSYSATGYTNPGSTYNPGDSYTTDSDVYMLAQWGPATFTPRDIPDKFVTVTYVYNGGTGSPASTAIQRAEVGYATTQGSTTPVYYPGTSGTTSTNVNLYPLYGNAELLLSAMPTPTKTGYNFEGWYRDSQLTDKITDKLVTSVDTSVYAKWSYIPQPVKQANLDGTWHDFGRYVWRMMDSDHQWHQNAHVYYFTGTEWIDISEQPVPEPPEE